MIVLALDTASVQCAACVFDAGTERELSRVVRPMTTGHASALSAVIDEALAAAGIHYRDLGRIVAVNGPGSFTGVRIAVAAARGLALALDIPSVGVDALEALALPVRQRHAGRTVMAALDAKRGEIYAAAWDGEGVALLAPSAHSIAEARAFARGHDAVLTGTGASVLAALETFPIDGAAAAPDIGVVARLGATRPARPATPLYLRKPDAKEQSAGILPRRPA